MSLGELFVVILVIVVAGAVIAEIYDRAAKRWGWPR